MTDEPLPDDDWLPITSEGDGVTVIWVTGNSQRNLTERIAITLGEHMQDGDDLHMSYNAIQSGWTSEPGRPGGIMRPAQPSHTTLQFEHTAIIVLRRRQPPAPP